MATEAAEVGGTRQLVEYVVKLPSEKQVDAFIEDLAKQEPKALPALVARATPIRKVLQYIEKVGEAAIASRRILNFGDEWADPETGIVHEFRGEPQDWKVLDPDGLHAALEKAGVPKDRLERAMFKVWKLNHTELNGLAEMNVEAKEAIDDFRSRGFAPAHLKEKK